MKNDSKLTQEVQDFKDTFDLAGHSCLWSILEGFGVPDVFLIKNIYENSSMRVQVGGEHTAAIQQDIGTGQGSVLSQLLFDLCINACSGYWTPWAYPIRRSGTPRTGTINLLQTTSHCTQKT